MIDEGTKLINKLNAWLKNKNPWVTIENPNTSDKKRQFVKIRANQLWGDPRGKPKKVEEPV
jgi:hypothetical protein